MVLRHIFNSRLTRAHQAGERLAHLLRMPPLYSVLTALVLRFGGYILLPKAVPPGNTLVDAALPDQMQVISAALVEAGSRSSGWELRRIIVGQY